MNTANQELPLVTTKLKQAIAYHQKGQLAQAQELYEEILKKEPKHFDALHLLGVIAAQTRNPQRAVELISKAIEIHPYNAGFYSNRGNAFQELRQFDAALASYDKAIAIKPDYAEAYYNRGIVLQELKQFDAALASYDKTIAIKPDYAEAYWNKSLVLLLGGDFDKGWTEYEWRWKRENKSIEKRNFVQPLWHGKESLVGKTILLYSEQGLGDAIQFCRYAKLVADLGARVILEVQRPLMSLLANLEGIAQLVEKGSNLPMFHYQCPLLSLPLAFKTKLNTIPSATKYLSSEASRVAKWQAKLGEKISPRIGLVWSGSTFHINDYKRSILLADLIKHLPTECQYVSLQKEVREIDAKYLQSYPNILHFGNELNDFGDTAALCDLMDIVISVDTSVAHLSGALGRPTWILLTFSPEWRWLLDRLDSPWYQTAKLYRQEKIGDWESVLEKVKKDLIESVKAI
jgi:tetratricopeptide (TPR) repeat protein